LRRGSSVGAPNVVHVLITVTDSGVGVPANLLNKLFMSFSQGDSSIRRKFGGTGLGLAISKHIVEAMRPPGGSAAQGGRMWITSQEGKGTTVAFSLYLQVAQATPDSNRRSLTPQSHTPKLQAIPLPPSLTMPPTTLGSRGLSSDPTAAAASSSLLLLCSPHVHPATFCMLHELLSDVSPRALARWSMLQPNQDAAGASPLLTGERRTLRQAKPPLLLQADDMPTAARIWLDIATRAIAPSALSPPVLQRASSSAARPPLSWLVFEVCSARSVQPELDRLLECFEQGATSSGQPADSLRAVPLRILLLASRWRLTAAQQDGSAPNNNASVCLSEHQKQQWPNLRVRVMLAPVPHRELLLTLLDAADDGEDVLSSPFVLGSAASETTNVFASAAAAGASDPTPRLWRPAALLNADGGSHSAPVPSVTRARLQSPSSSLSLYTPRSAVRSIRPTAASRKMMCTEEPLVESPVGEAARAAGSWDSAAAAAAAAMVLAVPTHHSEATSAVSSTAGALPPDGSLPLVSSVVAASAPVVAEKAVATPRRRRVAAAIAPLQPRMPFNLLIVEDNAVNIRLMCILVQKLGWNLAPTLGQPQQTLPTSSQPPRGVCTDGQMCLQTIEQALQQAEASQSGAPAASDAATAARALVPQVVLMDVSMEPMDGLECAALIRSSFVSRYRALGLRAPFIIACTANVTQENKRHCAQAGMHHFLGKPVSLDLLIRALERAGRYVFGTEEEALAAAVFTD